MSLCYLCLNQCLIHERYIDKFITNNLHSRRNKKYVIMLFRLAPYLFSKYDLSNSVLCGIHIPFQELNQSYDFIFNVYFHQPHLTFSDYEICDNCSQHICPMHQKYNPINYKRCHYCLKGWCVCLNCMYSSSEKALCDKLHKKKQIVVEQKVVKEDEQKEVKEDEQKEDEQKEIEEDYYKMFDLILDYDKKN